MTPKLLEGVRTGCRAVAERATHVQIAVDRLPSYAASLSLAQGEPPALDASCHYLGRGDDTVAFLLTLDAINFGSGYFLCLRKRPNMSGYFTIAAALTDYYTKRGAPLSAQELTSLTAEGCTHIFGQEIDNAPIRELMQLFATALNDLGRYVVAQFNGSFVAMVEAAGASAERLVHLLRQMPFFNDVERYAGVEVPFYKRAQLTAADLALAFEGQGPGHFEDLHQLTIFADNLVPHVLRVDGILRYDDVLAARIEAEELIPAGSVEEVEIRACAVHAVELLVQAGCKSGHPVTAMTLDYVLWNRGQQPSYKRRPRHRTRTIFY